MIKTGVRVVQNPPPIHPVAIPDEDKGLSLIDSNSKYDLSELDPVKYFEL